jgi:hypothetical protein
MGLIQLVVPANHKSWSIEHRARPRKDVATSPSHTTPDSQGIVCRCGKDCATTVDRNGQDAISVTLQSLQQSPVVSRPQSDRHVVRPRVHSPIEAHGYRDSRVCAALERGEMGSATDHTRIVVSSEPEYSLPWVPIASAKRWPCSVPDEGVDNLSVGPYLDRSVRPAGEQTSILGDNDRTHTRIHLEGARAAAIGARPNVNR